MSREVTWADLNAYNQLIQDTESRAELLEELIWIRNELAGSQEGVEDGGMKLVKKP